MARFSFERYNPTNPKSSKLRFHTQTAGVTLTAQQPLNNAVRVSYQALAAVLGGTQSLHTNSYDEAIGLPTEKSALLALRTQQILANETNITNSVDPLAGSYLVEELTSKLYINAKQLIEEIDKKGGAMQCVVSGYQQRHIHEAAWNQLQAIEDGTTNVVGVNKYIEDENSDLVGQLQNPALARLQSDNLQRVVTNRDSEKARLSIERIEEAAKDGSNLMDPLIDAFKAEVTLGEVNDVLRGQFGTWIAPSGV